jgi:hypothetical protein
MTLHDTPIGPYDVDVKLFTLGWPFVEGWYWRIDKLRIIRGPFASQEEAMADAERTAAALCRIIAAVEGHERKPLMPPI